MGDTKTQEVWTAGAELLKEQCRITQPYVNLGGVGWLQDFRELGFALPPQSHAAPPAPTPHSHEGPLRMTMELSVTKSEEFLCSSLLFISPPPHSH